MGDARRDRGHPAQDGSQHHYAGQQEPAVTVDYGEDQRHHGKREITSARQAQEHRAEGNGEKQGAGGPDVSLSVIQEHGRRDAYQRDQVERHGIWSVVDDDRWRQGEVDRVMPDGVQDHDGVGDACHRGSDREPGHDEPGSLCIPSHVPDHEEKGDRLHQVRAVQTKSFDLLG